MSFQALKELLMLVNFSPFKIWFPTLKIQTKQDAFQKLTQLSYLKC